MSKLRVFLTPCSLILCNVAGGTLIHVWGHNFPESPGNSQYTCKFRSVVVNATREAWNHVTCRAPQHVAYDVTLEVSPDGVEYTNNDVRIYQLFMCGCILPRSDNKIHQDVIRKSTLLQLTFTFYATCPENSCGRDLDPPRGQCRFGGCSCYWPWTGDYCTVGLLTPVVETPADKQVAEGSAYEHQLVLTQVWLDTCTCIFRVFSDFHVFEIF